MVDSRANSLTVSSLLGSVGAARSAPMIAIAISKLALQLQLEFMMNYAGNVARVGAILEATGARSTPKAFGVNTESTNS